MDNKDIILTAATLFGPVVSALIAIYYTRYADKAKLKMDRRIEVLRNLMKTRGFRLHPDHVMSLNLIQTDFNDDANVMADFKNYIDHLYKTMPTTSPEDQRFDDEREMLFGKLLISIAKSLDINLQVDEVKHFRYSPTGWASAEIEQQQVRKLLISVLQGITPISVKSAAQPQPPAAGMQTLFPPSPDS